MTHCIAKLAIFALVCSVSVFGQKRTIDLASYDYLPFNGQSLKESGAITKLTVMVFEKAGYTVKVTNHNEPWARILSMAKGGEFDALVSIWESKDRDPYMATTDATMNNEVGFAKLKADTMAASNLHEVADLNVNIGTVRGYAQPKALSTVKFTFDEADNDGALVAKLMAGRDRLILTDKAVAAYYANKLGSGAATKLQWLFTVESLPLRTGIVKTGKADWQDVVKDYDNALAALQREGTVNKVLREYGLKF